jgi:hypothetical protein
VLGVGVPLFQISFFFDLIHIYLLPFDIDIFPAFAQAAPGLTDACAARTGLEKRRVTSTVATKARYFMP